MEHNISDWHQSKLMKYENELRIEAERNRWKFHSIAVEVGARGWIPSNVFSSLSFLGVPAVKSLQSSQSVGCEIFLRDMDKSV
jgi:hypothetical protein